MWIKETIIQLITHSLFQWPDVAFLFLLINYILFFYIDVEFKDL